MLLAVLCAVCCVLCAAVLPSDAVPQSFWALRNFTAYFPAGHPEHAGRGTGDMQTCLSRLTMISPAYVNTVERGQQRLWTIGEGCECAQWANDMESASVNRSPRTAIIYFCADGGPVRCFFSAAAASDKYPFQSRCSVCSVLVEKQRRRERPSTVWRVQFACNGIYLAPST